MNIPNGHTLDKRYNKKKISSKKYVPFTLADLIEFAEAAGWPLNTPLWVSEYLEAIDDVVVHPVETVGGNNGNQPHILLG